VNVKPSGNKMTVAGLLNPAVFRFERKTWLLMRVAERPEQIEGYVTVPIPNDVSGEMETLQFSKTDPHLDFTDPAMICYKGKRYFTTISHLKLMYSANNKEFYEPENYDDIFGKGELEAYGIEDCRVTEMNDTFYLTYTMVSSYGMGIGLIQTRDWKRFDRKGMIFSPHNRDCAIFEEKIRDRFCALHSPGSQEPGGKYIWLAESPDSIHWGNHKCIATTRMDMWDSAQIGAGSSPIRTPHGWLAIYYGADETNRCCLGALLLDIKDPSRVIGRSNSPLMEPTESYESNGFSGNRIFTNGHLVVGDKLYLYYGAGGDVICGAELSITEILGSLLSLKK
jgi:beta-1,2-mannobiose phosphorylase / 1,2-beta-oligomannan phosphorylase